MAEYKDREHFIPLRRTELIEMLAADRDLPPADREAFRQLCRLLSAVFHFEYHQRLEDLKEAYTLFDPDADTKPLRSYSAEERQQRLDRLFQDITSLMERANFKRLGRDDVEEAMKAGASDWGINMDVDFAVFERLEIFARGDTIGRRTRRRLRNLWRLEEVKLPTYQRLVLVIKLNPHKRLGRNVDTKDVYLKLFKDIPKLDLEMLLPGARVKMPGLERGKLGASLLTTVGWIGYKIAQEVGQLATAFIQKNPLAFWGPLSLVAGYGYRQYAGFQTTKKSYSMMLTESLYYQNLDNNAGVITRLLDAAEEQEAREAILAYYYLWRYAGQKGWTASDLDEYVELDLEGKASIKIDFEIDDALAKLVRLQIVEAVDDRYRARPIADALRQLDYTWDNYFQYNKEEDRGQGSGARGQEALIE